MFHDQMLLDLKQLKIVGEFWISARVGTRLGPLQACFHNHLFVGLLLQPFLFMSLIDTLSILFLMDISLR